MKGPRSKPKARLRLYREGKVEARLDCRSSPFSSRAVATTIVARKRHGVRGWAVELRLDSFVTVEPKPCLRLASRFSPLLAASRRLSPPLAASHRFSPLLAASHRFSPLLTASRRFSPPLTASRRLSPPLTASRRLSPLLAASRRLSPPLQLPAPSQACRAYRNWKQWSNCTLPAYSSFISERRRERQSSSSTAFVSSVEEASPTLQLREPSAWRLGVAH